MIKYELICIENMYYCYTIITKKIQNKRDVHSYLSQIKLNPLYSKIFVMFVVKQAFLTIRTNRLTHSFVSVEEYQMLLMKGLLTTLKKCWNIKILTWKLLGIESWYIIKTNCLANSSFTFFISGSKYNSKCNIYTMVYEDLGI